MPHVVEVAHKPVTKILEGLQVLEEEEVQKRKVAVIKIGGSETIDELGISRAYIENLINEIQDSLENYDQVIFIVGGGNRARVEQDKVREKNRGMDKDKLNDELDLAGIGTTQEHALQLIDFLAKRDGIFAGFNQKVPKNQPDAVDLIKEKNKIGVLGGLQKGQTTDAVAAWAADQVLEIYGKDAVDLSLVVLSNVDAIREEDPKDNPDARKISIASLVELVKKGILSIGGSEYKPGMHTPIDPVAVSIFIKVLAEANTRLLFALGTNFPDIIRYLQGDFDEIEGGTQLTNGEGGEFKLRESKGLSMSAGD